MKKNKNSYLSPIKLISKDSAYFPKNLYKLPDCPEILFVLGNEKILNHFSLSMIGTRTSSKLGNEIAQELSSKLSSEGITIVSGMASGIDTHAHIGASLDSKKTYGTTIAIVACGFEHIFTQKNTYLIEKIIKSGGAIISEYFPDTPPQPFSFLKRNRLVAAISEALIVVEAPLKSGALNTAQSALKLNKPVFAIPWSINLSKGEGCNNLLKNNAHVLTDYTQILSFFHISSKVNVTVSQLTNTTQAMSHTTNIPTEFKKLYHYISQNHPTTKDSIYSHFSSENIATINSKLILMELQNLIIVRR